MAQLALAGAGAVLGGALGSALGATSVGLSIGWALGGLAGSMLFGPKLPSVEGPRLADLTVHSSTYGNPIPIVYGTVRLSGNIIWSSGLKETAITRRVRAKGGRRQTVTEYQYNASWAIAFCEGPIDDVLKIWFDSHLVYDSTGASLDKVVSGLSFRIYKGTETQLPDPLIEQNVGAANAVPFRGMFYIVFDNVPLAQVGNRIPSVSVLVTKNSTKVPTQYALPASANPISDLSVFSLEYCVDAEKAWLVYQLRTSAQRSLGLRIFDLKEERTWDVSLQNPTNNSFDACAVRDDYFFCREGVASSRRGFLFNVRTGEHLGTFGLDDGSSISTLTSFVQNSCAPIIVRLYSINGPEYYYIVRPRTNPLYIIKIPDMTYIAGSNSSTSGVPHAKLFDDFPIGLYQHDCLCLGKEDDGFAEAYYCYRSGTNLNIRKIVIRSNATGGPFFISNVSADLVAEIPFDTITPNITTFHTPSTVLRGACYDATDNSIIVSITLVQTGPLITETWLLKIRNGTVVWTRCLSTSLNSPSDPTEIANDTVFDGLHRNQISYIFEKTSFMFFRTSPTPMRATSISTVDGSILDQQTWGLTAPNIVNSIITNRSFIITEQDAMAYVPTTGQPWKIRWPILQGDGETVANIILDLCQRAGLSPAELNVSDLSSDIVSGFIVSKPMSVRAAIEPLASAYLFDAVERGDTIVFRKRGGSSVITIPFDDLIREEDSIAIEETRAQDADLFRSIVVRHIDPDRNYEIGTQQWARPLVPVETTASIQTRVLDLPIVMSASTTKERARRIILSAWRERTRYKFALSHKYLRLEPSDPITITRSDNTTVRCRIVSSVFEKEWKMRLEVVEEDVSVYNVSAVADAGQGTQVETLQAYARPAVFSDNIPLIDASHETNGTGCLLYFFSGPYVGKTYSPQRVFHWSGTSFIHVDDLPKGVSWGYVLGQVPAPQSYWTWDRTTEITVWVENGLDDFVTASELEVLNGENVALIMSDTRVEVIQFQTVTPLSGNRIRLSNLLRGRYGTEDAGEFASGAVVVLYDSVAWRKILIPSSSVNTRQRLRFVGPNLSWQRGIERGFTFVGRAEQPWAPVHIAGSRDTSNNLTITWVRRTRFSGELVNGTGTVPLNEQSEAYDVEIRNMADTTTLRTFSNLSSPTVTYTASQQTADGITPGDPVRVRVYQLSALVGRGRMGTAVV